MFASGSVVKPEPLSITNGQDENLDTSGSVVKLARLQELETSQLSEQERVKLKLQELEQACILFAAVLFI